MQVAYKRLKEMQRVPPKELFICSSLVPPRVTNGTLLSVQKQDNIITEFKTQFTVKLEKTFLVGKFDFLCINMIVKLKGRTSGTQILFTFSLIN